MFFCWQGKKKKKAPLILTGPAKSGFLFRNTCSPNRGGSDRKDCLSSGWWNPHKSSWTHWDSSRSGTFWNAAPLSVGIVLKGNSFLPLKGVCSDCRAYLLPMTHLDGVHLKGQETEAGRGPGLKGQETEDKGRPRQAVWTCSQEEERHKRIRKITAARLPRVWDSGGLVPSTGTPGQGPSYWWPLCAVRCGIPCLCPRSAGAAGALR